MKTWTACGFLVTQVLGRATIPCLIHEASRYQALKDAARRKNAVTIGVLVGCFALRKETTLTKSLNRAISRANNRS